MTAGQKFFPDLPSGWRNGRLLEVSETRTSNIDKHSVDGQRFVRLCNYVDVYYNETITADINYMHATATDAQIDRFRLCLCDILITKDSESADDIGIPAYVEYQSSDLVCGYHLAIIRPRQKRIDPKYLFWVMCSDPTLLQWSVRATGVTRVGIKTNDLARAVIPIPPRIEQKNIAGYLDRETRNIDTLITEQRSLIETLRERRRVVIDDVFLRRATGSRRLRRLLTSSITGPFGTQLKASEYVNDCVPVVNPTHIVDSRIRPDRSITVTNEKSVELERFRIIPGDVILGRKGDVDKAAVVSKVEEGYICGSDSMALRPSGEVNGEYLWWYLQSPSAHRQLEQWSVGSTVAGLNQRTISHLEIPTMDLSGQLEICAYLNAQTSRIDELISESEDLIALSQERRAALITAAVTGQIDVRTTA